MEDVEDEMQVAKTDIDILQTRMSSSEGEVSKLQSDMWDIEMSVDNSHLCLEKVED